MKKSLQVLPDWLSATEENTCLVMPNPSEGLRESVRWIPQYFFSLKTSLIKLGILEIQLVFRLWHLELVRKENGGWNPEKTAR